MIKLSAFRWVPPFAQGLVRDVRARWALEADRFTAADLLLTTVLRIPRHTTILAEHPTLDAYRLRCEARPAFKKALAAQLRPFAENAPAAA